MIDAMPTPLPYEPAEPVVQGAPLRALARFIPTAPLSAATAWLEQIEPKSGNHWLIDPFGASPMLPVAAARAGWRILVSANNPIQRFLLEKFASPPTQADLRLVLAELAASRKGSERLELHLRALYASKCPACGANIEVHSFIWERSPNPEQAQQAQFAQLVARLLTCDACGANGEFPPSPQDMEQAERYAVGGLHYARALERVAAANDPDRVHALEALAVYLPRAIYGLFTLINKLDGLNLSSLRQANLAYLILHACDQCSSLSGHPAEREHPKALIIPPRFREHNLWRVLEEAAQSLGVQPDDALNAIPVTVFPNFPPTSGGICLFEGPLRDFLGLVQSQNHTSVYPPFQFKASLCVLPRPNQAFWTLSALWAGWLWGQESAAAFKSVLRRRRYDWAWHTTALQAALENLAGLLEPGTPFLALSEENEPGLVSAICIAAYAKGFDLTGIEARGASLHILWLAHKAQETPSVSHLQRREAAGRYASDYLHTLGQPSTHIRLFMAGLAGLASDHLLPDNSSSPAENYSSTQSALRDALTFSGGFHRYNPGESPEIGLYWLRSDQQTEEPLVDRLEKLIVPLLLKRPGISTHELERAACQIFPGLLTPNREQILACLTSYAIEDPANTNHWTIRPEDRPTARRTDLTAYQGLLESLGNRLGYKVSGEAPVIWINSQGQICFAFYRIVSAVIGHLLHTPLPADPGAAVILLPGGRASLVVDKLRHNPRLAQLAQNWHFLKARHLRLLNDSPGLTADNFQQRIDEDPLTGPQPQMRLL